MTIWVWWHEDDSQCVNMKVVRGLGPRPTLSPLNCGQTGRWRKFQEVEEAPK